MNRRRFLKLAAGASPLIAGCASQSGQQTDTDVPTDIHTSTVTRPGSSPSSTVTETEASSPTSAGANIIYVGPDGVEGNDGSKQSPVNRIQEALEHAQPGDTIYVKPGQYFESLRTRRPGEPGKPITITGPPDAIVSGNREAESSRGLTIRHSHFHLTGLTFDGLQDPSKSEDINSYMDSGVGILPAGAEYLTDIKMKPHRLGNVLGNLIKVGYATQVEVGEFRVIGPSGLGYLLTDRAGHWGEIVYVGTPPGQSPNAITPTGELRGIDTSNQIHIHHIDNSEGHAHSELVNTKLGTYDVLVEYCTDGGGSQNTEPPEPAASIRLQSYGVTVRWCDLRNGQGHGIAAGVGDLPEGEEHKRPADSGSAIYGNHVSAFDEKAFRFENIRPSNTEDANWRLCGNDYEGETDADPDAACSGSVPTGDGIGHTGGDAPW